MCVKNLQTDANIFRSHISIEYFFLTYLYYYNNILVL